MEKCRYVSNVLCCVLTSAKKTHVNAVDLIADCNNDFLCNAGFLSKSELNYVANLTVLLNISKTIGTICENAYCTKRKM